MKKILIAFQDNKDILTHSSKESILNSLISGMIDSGKTITDFSVPNASDRVVTFDDGSEIHVKSLSHVYKAEKYTHVYIDKFISEHFSFAIAVGRFNKLLIEDADKYSTEGSRLNSYEIKDGNLFINKM